MLLGEPAKPRKERSCLLELPIEFFDMSRKLGHRRVRYYTAKVERQLMLPFYILTLKLERRPEGTESGLF